MPKSDPIIDAAVERLRGRFHDDLHPTCEWTRRGPMLMCPDAPTPNEVHAILTDLRRDADEELARLEDALRYISQGRGAFSLDHLTHASNCIEEMKTTALRALAKEEVTSESEG